VLPEAKELASADGSLVLLKVIVVVFFRLRRLIVGAIFEKAGEGRQEEQFESRRGTTRRAG
jgi:hypothetical protein